MPARCLIVDDEDLARQQITRLLAAQPDFLVIGEARNGVEALELIPELKPEVIFLDIEMPGLNGFDMLAQLRESPLIVFATAYDEFAIRAFDANAIDYLLKPIQPARLAQALEKVQTNLLRSSDQYQASLFSTLATLRPGPPAKLAGRRGKRIVLLSPKEIIYAAIEDKLVFLYTETERFLTDRTIVELDQLLTPAGFFRISRGAVVNLEHARELLPWFSGTWRLKLSNQVELDVSRDRSRLLRSKIG
jgi:two-component system LytT family response regulator